MRFFVHSSAARGRRWMKLQSNEFEPKALKVFSFLNIKKKGAIAYCVVHCKVTQFAMVQSITEQSVQVKWGRLR